MATNLSREIFGVKAMLGDPLDQSPSIRQICDELEAEYQTVTNEVNNKGNSQHIAEEILTTSVGKRSYDIGSIAKDFYKALSVTTIPSTAVLTPVAGDPQGNTITVSSGIGRSHSLEFTELENINDDWGHLRSNSGQLMGSSHDSQMIAIYKVIIPQQGEVVRVEMRPTPNSAQKYLILYQTTDWWDKSAPIANAVSEDTGAIVTQLPFNLPHSSQRMYVRALVARNLLPITRWGLDDVYNVRRHDHVREMLDRRIDRYRKVYEDYLDTMDHGGMIYIELFGDRL